MSDSRLVERNFSRGAATYDAASEFQLAAAGDLADFIAARIPPERVSGIRRIVEFGCGTGFLTSRLLKVFPSAEILASDISPKMLELCKAKLGSGHESRVSFSRYDFNEQPQFGRRFDLAVSALSFQWGTDLDATLLNVRSCIAEGGLLLFSIPLSSSLGELRETFKAGGVPFPGLRLPEISAIEGAVSRAFKRRLVCVKNYDGGGGRSLLEHLKSLKMSGTVNASGDSVPLPSLRRLLAISGSRLLKAGYEVAFCLCEN